MKIVTLSPQNASKLLRAVKTALGSEASLWERAERGMLLKGEEAPEVKSQDLLTMEYLETMAVVYSLTDIGPKEIDMIALPLARDLSQTFPAVSVLVLESAAEGLDISPETMERFQSFSHRFTRFRQDAEREPRLLIGIAGRRIQEALDPMAFVRVTDKTPRAQ